MTVTKPTNQNVNGVQGEEKIEGLNIQLNRFKAQNALRRPCPRCRNIVLPALLDQHIRVYHR